MNMKLPSLCVCLSLAAATGLVPAVSSAQNADSGGDIGYPSVDAARKALEARPDVTMSRVNGWLSVEDPVNKTLWTFAPEDDPAHPAAIKRTVVEEFDRVVIVMDIRCEGDAGACDALEEHFLSLNESTRNQVEHDNENSQD